MHVPLELIPYMVAYLIAVAVALVSVGRQLVSAEHRRFLCEPWRLVTFVLATTLIAGVAPYSGDPTWDVPNSILIGALTYLLAPWTVQAFRRRENRWAAAVLFFVPCWAYDLYILARDDYYPTSWDANLVLSGILCLCAGLFWNLSWTPSTRYRALGAMGLLALPLLVMVVAFVVTA